MHLQLWIMSCISIIGYAQMTKYLERTQNSKYLQKQWLLPRSLISLSIKTFILFQEWNFREVILWVLEKASSIPRLWALLLINHSGCVYFSCVFINISQSLLNERTVYTQNKHLCYALTTIFLRLGGGSEPSVSLFLNFSRFLRSPMNCQFICCQ